MGSQETVSEWIRELGKQLDLDLKLDDEGLCAIEFKGDVIMMIEVGEESPIFHVYASIMEIPEDEVGVLTLFQAALELNLFTAETNGATIAFSSDLGALMLCYADAIEGCGFDQFGHIVQGFYETILEVREKLKETISGEEGEGNEKPKGIRA